MNIVKKHDRTEMPMTRWAGDVWDWFDSLFSAGPPMEAGLVPATDIEETDEAYVIRSELPGVDVKDVEVTLRNDMLVIRGEKREEQERKEGGFRRSERRYGAFHRELRLPGSVDASKIEAKCHSGILTVTVPKVETAKPRRIEIHGE